MHPEVGPDVHIETLLESCANDGEKVVKAHHHLPQVQELHLLLLGEGPTMVGLQEAGRLHSQQLGQDQSLQAHHQREEAKKKDKNVQELKTRPCGRLCSAAVRAS